MIMCLLYAQTFAVVEGRDSSKYFKGYQGVYQRIKTWEDRKYPLFYCLNNNKIAIRYNVILPIDNEDSTNYFRGFGGRLFTIKTHDGKIIHTTNLWHQRTIPKEFYKGDNAEFI